MKTVQTIARAYQQICAGEDPWIALGNFRNAWYSYAKDKTFLDWLFERYLGRSEKGVP